MSSAVDRLPRAGSDLIGFDDAVSRDHGGG
jgi:hypothetical protein